jgi:hypothetical protein
MANLLPLLLIGGGAAAVMAAGKKKGGYKFEYLRVGPGCKTVFLNGKNLIDGVKRVQEGDEDARAMIVDDVKLFWLEDMPALILKVQPDEEDLERGAEQLVKASLPSCYRSKKAMVNSLKKHAKEAKGEADLEKRLMPMLSRYLVLMMIYAGYQVNLIRDGKMDAGNLSDLEKDLMDVLPENMHGMTGEGEAPADPNQMAATRPGWITEAAFESTSRG